MTQPPQEVILSTKGTTASALGTASFVVGVLALLFGWIPFLGLLAIPVATIGILLAGLGLLIAMFNGLRGAGMPLLGAAICVAAWFLPLASTGGASVVLQETMEHERVPEAPVAETPPIAAPEGQDQENAIKTAYIAEHLELYDVSAKYMDSLLNERVPGVFFKLRNKGERSLDMVEVTVYFKDVNGTVIAEDEYTPVLVSVFGDNKPLKPNYIWQMERGGFQSADSVPSEWEEGNIVAVITEIRFTK